MKVKCVVCGKVFDFTWEAPPTELPLHKRADFPDIDCVGTAWVPAD